MCLAGALLDASAPRGYARFRSVASPRTAILLGVSLAVSAVRVLVVLTVAVYRHGLADALGRRDELDLVTSAATPSEALQPAAVGHEAYPDAEGRHVVC